MAALKKDSQRSKIAPFRALSLFAAAQKLEAEGQDIIHLEVGQPAKGATAKAKKALEACLQTEDALGYTAALGRQSLRERLAQWYQERYAIQISPEQVVITPGSSGGFQLAFLAAFDATDRLAMGDPSYPAYRAIAQALGLEVVRLETQASEGRQVTPEQIQAAAEVQSLQGVMLASPANPTGTALSRPQLQAIAETSHKLNARLIVDEIYHGTEFGQQTPSALEVSDEAIVISSFSKLFRLTGWRIGWMVLPQSLLPAVERLAQNLFICAPHASQILAEAVFEDMDSLKADNHQYAINCEKAVQALQRLGFAQVTPPDGAFYIYLDLEPLLKPGEDSMAWCQALLTATGVAIAPGYDFDPVRGHKTARLSFCVETERLETALERLGNWLANR